MRIFEPLQELEVYDGDRLVGVYVPGLQYNCMDDNAMLAATLDQWLQEGRARVIEHREGTGPALVSGQGNVE
jgi:hypothetical protein